MRLNPTSHSQYRSLEQQEGDMTKYVYQSTKTYEHNIGLSACFRQWRAESHCKYLHGYSLLVKFTFETAQLDDQGWVVDFGSLKSLKGWMEDTFDHKCLVATDDPEYNRLNDLDIAGVIQMVEVPSTGCEAFAKMVFEATEVWLTDNGYSPRCYLRSVEVREHGANSAIYKRVD